MNNIVLIGMPGSGKTFIGNKLAKATGKTLIDMDDEIIKKAAATQRKSSPNGLNS